MSKELKEVMMNSKNGKMMMCGDGKMPMMKTMSNNPGMADSMMSDMMGNRQMMDMMQMKMMENKGMKKMGGMDKMK